MSYPLFQLVTDNGYVLPKVATVLQIRNVDDWLLYDAMDKDLPIFVVSNNLSDEEQLFDCPYEIGTVVKLVDIKFEKGEYKLYVIGLYRAKRTAYWNDEHSNYVTVERLNEKRLDFFNMEIAYSSLLDTFYKYASLEDSLTAYQIYHKFEPHSIELKEDYETMEFLMNKLTQLAIDNFPFHPTFNQEIIEEDNIVARVDKVIELIQEMLLENYNRTYHFPDYEDELPTLSVLDQAKEKAKEDNELIESIEKFSIPKLEQEKNEQKNNQEKSESPSYQKEVIQKIEMKINALDLPKESRTFIQSEIDKMKILNDGSNEYRETLNYLRFVLKLPWNKEREERSIADAEKLLHETHYGMDIVKKEIIKYLAERKLNKRAKGAVLCLAGPPGVGKTSLVKSVAKALNKEFIQVKLGGVYHEPMIRGFERTYRSAQPGVFIQQMAEISSTNPLILLDEIDKIGKNHGEQDVSAALLEVLDPMQNNEFQDRYLTIPYDLSKALFIATANDIDKIPAPLRDRMEIIYLDGYTKEEKFHILKYYIIQKTLQNGWLKDYEITIDDDVLMTLVDQTAHEAGIRSLERKVHSLYRKIALKIETEQQKQFHITTANMNEYFQEEKIVVKKQIVRHNEIGRANVLLVSNNGIESSGFVRTLEASKFLGNGNVITTGSLGDVTRESIEVAFSYIRYIAESLKIDQHFKQNYDFHLHFPDSVIPKDGPSAGVSIVTAILSILLNEPIQSNVAMTGEISLYGNVKSVGDIKAKIIGAYEHGITKAIIPRENKKDIDHIPLQIQKEMEIIFVDNIDEVFEHVFKNTYSYSK